MFTVEILMDMFVEPYEACCIICDLEDDAKEIYCGTFEGMSDEIAYREVASIDNIFTYDAERFVKIAKEKDLPCMPIVINVT